MRTKAEMKIKEGISTQLQVIPDGSFVVIKTDQPDLVVEAFHGKIMEDWKTKGLLGGLILPRSVGFEVFNDQGLKEIGLKKIDLCPHWPDDDYESFNVTCTKCGCKLVQRWVKADPDPV